MKRNRESLSLRFALEVDKLTVCSVCLWYNARQMKLIATDTYSFENLIERGPYIG